MQSAPNSLALGVGSLVRLFNIKKNDIFQLQGIATVYLFLLSLSHTSFALHCVLNSYFSFARWHCLSILACIVSCDTLHHHLLVLPWIFCHVRSDKDSGIGKLWNGLFIARSRLYIPVFLVHKLASSLCLLCGSMAVW